MLFESTIQMMYVKGGNWFTQARRYEISASVGSNARAIATDTEECGRRAKESQDIARKAEEEAKEVALTAIYLKNDYDKWFGLGKFFSDM